ncbi:transcriptional regulator, AsnC family [Thermomonospora echinospora]|uniref:Transcriptional regulator, AsnC family n=1 Tax=Thermomonospora echinospora TaxID=1992 RepID=A0A1H5TI94_9ACTN|nr:Lrp/AsnC family transcriptional regulator [Thermomonospora echinospora]SEF62592.1 transcriptional regulator, AsnC family [Thermomonospora echinospora]
MDRRILALVQRDARLTAAQIGERVGLSASAAHRRLQRLWQGRVVEAQVAVVNPRAVGRPLVMIVGLEIERERPEDLHELKRWLAAEPAVQQAWYVTGDADFTLVITARDTEDYDGFMQRLVAENRNVRKFKTSVVLSTLKRGLAVPVDGGD